MTVLANDQAMGELRVDAAIHTGSATLMRELILRDRTLSDDDRLRLLAALFELDPGSGVEVAERFAGTAREVESRLRIAEMLHPYGPDVARRIATEVAWPAREKIDGWVRLRAARLLGASNPPRRSRCCGGCRRTTRSVARSGCARRRSS